MHACQLEVLTKAQFDALDEAQVQAINSKQLSKALKNKLLQPFDLSFVEKLSSEQICSLLGNHTGFRLKNWGTFFKDNFTADALKYMRDKKSEDDAVRLVQSFDGISLNDLELYRLRKTTKRLSEELRETILYKFQEKQNRYKAILLGQFKKISIVAPAKLAQRVLWTKASHTILVKMPAGYQKIEVAFRIKN